MLEVNLGRGFWAFIDKEDEDILSYGSWCAHNSKNNHYACMRTRGPGNSRERIWMHTLLLERKIGKKLNQGELADHIDGNTLNNCRGNLRLANRTQNEINKRKRVTESSSQYKGVAWDKQKKKWRSYITVNGKLLHLGFFKNEKDAALAYDEAAVEYYGEFAKINEE